MVAPKRPTGNPGRRNPVATEAKRLLALGFPLVPVRGKKPTCNGWGKEQIPADVLLGELRADPALGIGLICNLSPLVDVECDDDAAEAALQAMFPGGVPPTPTFRSRRGLHRLFKRPAGLPEAVKSVLKLDGVEVRGLNPGAQAQSVMPPSPFEGGVRSWLPGLRLGDVEPAELPEAVIGRLQGFPPPGPKPENAGGGGKIPAGCRNEELFKVGCRLAEAGVTGDELLARLLAVNAERCDPPLPEGEVAAVAASVARGGVGAVPCPDLKSAQGQTETANAARLIARFGGDVRFVGPWKKWLCWDGKRWEADADLKLQGMAIQISRGLWADLAAVEPGTEAMRSALAFVKASNRANAVAAMVTLARSYVPVSVDELDSHVWLLNLANGTLDLRTGEVKEHDRADYLTKLSAVCFDPLATCPLWEKFLGEVFDEDDELIGYVRRLVGYTLTGSQREHVLPFLHGSGANGKSTFLHVLFHLLGPDYATKAPQELLLAKHGETHPTEKAGLFGRRLVFSNETEAGRRLAETQVKALTGGDRVEARRMREDFWEFEPTHTIWISGNHKPAVRGTDYGIWRRLKLIPFLVQFGPERQDRELPEKLLAELPGVLNWALAGLRDWLDNGMQEPDVVKSSTSDYAAEEDLLGQFLADFCDLDAGYTADPTALYREFVEHVAEWSQTALGRALAERGFEKVKGAKGVRRWRGLRLKSTARAEAVVEKLKKKRSGV